MQQVTKGELRSKCVRALTEDGDAERAGDDSQVDGGGSHLDRGAASAALVQSSLRESRSSLGAQNRKDVRFMCGSATPTHSDDARGGRARAAPEKFGACGRAGQLRRGLHTSLQTQCSDWWSRATLQQCNWLGLSHLRAEEIRS